MTDKAPEALRTIGEVVAATGCPAHILRYWETRFPQLRPLTRAGQRRYYRPSDIALVLRIKEMLYDQHLSTSKARALLDAEAGKPSRLSSGRRAGQSV